MLSNLLIELEERDSFNQIVADLLLVEQLHDGIGLMTRSYSLRVGVRLRFDHEYDYLTELIDLNKSIDCFKERKRSTLEQTTFGAQDDVVEMEHKASLISTTSCS